MKNHTLHLKLAISILFAGYLYLSPHSYAEDAPPQTRIGFVIVPSLKVGSEPGIKNPGLMGSLKYGDWVWIQNTRHIDNTQWLNIQKKDNSSLQGWVPSEYVGLLEDPNSVSKAVRRIEKEILKRIAKTPHVKELMQSPTADRNLSSLPWEELRLALIASLIQKNQGYIFDYLCAAYNTAPAENVKQKVVTLATLLHPTTIFDPNTFKTEACQHPAKIIDAGRGTPIEKWISYVHVWRSFW